MFIYMYIIYVYIYVYIYIYMFMYVCVYIRSFTNCGENCVDITTCQQTFSIISTPSEFLMSLCRSSVYYPEQQSPPSFFISVQMFPVYPFPINDVSHGVFHMWPFPFNVVMFEVHPVNILCQLLRFYSQCSKLLIYSFCTSKKILVLFPFLCWYRY